MSLTNTQYEQIMREYDEMHRLALLERERRLEYIKNNVPGYRELSSQISSLTLEHTKRSLSGDKAALSQLKNIISELSAKKTALLLDNGYPEDYLEPTFNCPDCNDTGYIGSKKCHCFRQKILSLLYDRSNIGKMLGNVSFDMLSEVYYKGNDLINFKDAKQKAMDFVYNFDTDYQNLLIYGTVGVGKSLLSSCIAKELLKRGKSVIYFSSASLFDELSKGTFDRGYGKDTLDNIYNCELLILDDLGTEMTNSFVVSSFFSLLNERLLRRKPIVISTNLSLETLRDKYTDRTFSRITGGFTFCNMTGPDIRKSMGLLYGN